MDESLLITINHHNQPQPAEEPRNIPELFATLMLAAMPIDDWQSWRFLRGLRSFGWFWAVIFGEPNYNVVPQR